MAGEKGLVNLAFAPLFQRLARSRRIMVAGCGGGFDVYCGLPLYLYLRPRAEAVFLGNLSFATLEEGTGERLAPGLTVIDADSRGSDDYFPERSLCRWLRGEGIETSVYCFSRTGVKTLAKGCGAS